MEMGNFWIKKRVLANITLTRFVSEAGTVSILSKIFKKKPGRKSNDNSRQNQDPYEPKDLPILRNYKDNLKRIQSELGNSTDITFREFDLQGSKGMAVILD